MKKFINYYLIMINKKAQKRIFINKIIYKYIIYFQQKVNNNFSIIF